MGTTKLTAKSFQANYGSSSVDNNRMNELRK